MDIKNYTDMLEEKKSDLISEMDNLSISFTEVYELDTSHYFSGLISEHAYSQADVYDSALLNWVAHGGDKYIGRYMEDGAFNTRLITFWELVRGGQVLELQEKLYKYSEKIIEMLVINYLLKVQNEIKKTLNKEDLVSLFAEVKNQIDYSDSLEDACSLVDGYIFKSEEDSDAH